jgi:hypothetical protein
MTEQPWTAPLAERASPPNVAPEREALDAWLNFHRDTLLTKCAGLTAEQLCERSVPPSNLSLLGLVRHLTEVERWWLRVKVDGTELPEVYCTEDNPDGDIDDADPAQAAADLDRYRAEVELARAAGDRHGLDETFPGRRHDLDGRWTRIHLIEEYARHNGHADLLRERIDGVTGE